MKCAVVLLSGGLDSATALYIAKIRGFKCYCLIFDYGQRHRREIEAAKKVARRAGCAYKIVKIKLPWGGSSLLDKSSKITAVTMSPCHHVTSKIPNTYVPARNIIFLSFALSYAETIGAKAIFIGAHTHDYSGYPDCRPEFFRAFSKVARVGTKTGVEHQKISIHVPLINTRKVDIVRLGKKLGVPIEFTWSCYRGKKQPCGTCDSCYYRAKGFREAGIRDPLFDSRQ